MAPPPLVEEPLHPAPMAPRRRPKAPRAPGVKAAPPTKANLAPYSTGDIKVLEVSTQPETTSSDPFRRIATWLFWLSLAISAILLFNLVFDVFKGSQAKLNTSADADRVISYLTTLSYCLATSLVVLALSVLYLSWEEKSAGGLITGCGLACHWVVPFLLFAVVGRTNATAAVAQSFRMAGFLMVAIGGARLASDGYRWFRSLPQRMTQAASVGIPRYAAEQATEAAFANVFSPCWQLSYCREVIRRQCPAFLAQTKCWKFGKGCFCDAEMFARIIAGENLPMNKPQEPKVSKRGKPPCGSCYIYLEHQAHKLRWLSPLSIPLAVGLTGLIWPLYGLIWERFGGLFGWLWRGLSYKALAVQGPPAKNAPTPIGQLSPEAVSILTRNMLGVALGFILMIAILRVIEMAVDKWKW